MGLLCDYFAAGTDEQAAALLQTGAPGGRPVVTGNGIEPVVQLSSLEALLTGRSVDDVMKGSAQLQPVAMADDGERLVLPLPAHLVAALAAASDDDLTRVVTPWSETEEFWGAGDPALLIGFLRDLAALARAATHDREQVYCWMSV